MGVLGEEGGVILVSAQTCGHSIDVLWVISNLRWGFTKQALYLDLTMMFGIHTIMGETHVCVRASLGGLAGLAGLVAEDAGVQPPKRRG